jgi:hypothetical protein
MPAAALVTIMAEARYIAVALNTSKTTPENRA